MHLTIAWFTNRRDPKFHWFYDSVANQMTEGDEIKILAIDFYTEEQGRPESLMAQCSKGPYRPYVSFHPPKPSVWQGKYRKTKENWFDASNARNTAICLCQDHYIVFADDLSIAMPGWLNAVKEGIDRGGITCGCYEKRKDITVENGIIVHSLDHTPGHDHRLNYLKNPSGPGPAPASWFYGCSLVVPVESMLKIGGFPEALTASAGYEDGIASVLLRNNNESFVIDPRMMTIESEELHHVPGNHFLRRDPCIGDPEANPKNDMSHAMLRIVDKLKSHPNYFAEGGIRGLRNKILSGGQFPVMSIPENCWFTGQRIEDL